MPQLDLLGRELRALRSPPGQNSTAMSMITFVREL